MIGIPTGIKCKVVDDPQETVYFWGSMSELKDKWLDVMERNSQGDCLCMVPDRGLVDVRKADVAEVVFGERWTK